MDKASDPEPEREKKIIVDEDWKAQVQAEKEKQDRASKGSQPPPSKSAVPLPPASLHFLVSSLAMQAMMSLGAMPHPDSGKTEVQLDQARHIIDMLAMLQEKTEGNRTPEETKTLENLLYDLRMGYIAVSQAATSGQ